MASGQNNIPDIKPPITPAVSKSSSTQPRVSQPGGGTPELRQQPDSVQLSPRAREASQLRARVEATPEVEPSRVNEARARLQNGSPNPAAQNARLAEKLLTEN
jgi:hypothetical protein